MESLVGTVFDGCGVEPGVAFWRVKGRKLVRAVGDSDELVREGRLRKLDCLVALHSVGQHRADRWVIHTWRGREAGIVNAGFAGTQAHKLSNLLGRSASSSRISIVENLDGQETDAWKALFPASPQVLDGRFEYATPTSKPVETTTPAVTKCWVLVEGNAFAAAAPTRASLRSTATLVIDAGCGVVYSWAGRKASRVDRALCEELARRVAKREYSNYPPSGGSALHVVQGDDDERHVLAVLDASSSREEEDVMTPVVQLWEWQEKTEWRRLPEENGRRSWTTLRGDGIFAVDAGGAAWVWKGRSVSTNDVDVPLKKANELLTRQRPSWFRGFESVADRFEPVMFREQFSGWDDEELEIRAYNPDAAHLAEKKRVPQRSIEAEAKRMAQAGVGSLEAVSDASDAWLQGDGLAARAGDDQRQSLSLDLVDGDDHRVDLYKIKDDDDSKKKECGLVATRDLVFSSSDMVIAVVTAKRGCVRVVYTWEGSTASLRARAAAGLKVQAGRLREQQHKDPLLLDGAFFADDLLHGDDDDDERKENLDSSDVRGDDEKKKKAISAVEHQLYTFENAEPPLLLAALGKPLLVLRGRNGGGYLRQRETTFEKVRSIRVARAAGVDGQDDRLVKATEESFEHTTRRYFDDRAAYVLVDDEKVRVVAGNACDAKVLSAAKAVAADDRLPFWLRQSASSPGGTITNDDDDSHTTGAQSWSGEVSTKKSLDLHTDVAPQPAVKATRPARLFDVSRAKRSVGGIFATDVGRTFRQADLASRGCFVLDAGADRLFAWIGSDATEDEAKLSLAVAATYAREVPEMLLYREARAEKKASVAARLHLNHVERKRERRDVVAPESVDVALVFEGDEPAAFVHCFQGWQPVAAAKHKQRGLEAFLARALVAEAPLAVTLLGEDEDAAAGPSSSSASSDSDEGETTTTKRREDKKRVVNSKAAPKLGLLERLGSTLREDGSLLRVTASGSPFAFDQSAVPLQDVLASVHDLRADFALWAYESKKLVTYVAHGTGGLAALRDACLSTPKVHYGILQRQHPTSPSVAVFGLVTFIPNGVSPLVRGAVGAHRAVVRDIFAPLHVDVTLTDLADADAVVDNAFADFIQHASI
eukprot:CAMPEP_0198647212 /NCGR_PEP_ID=MMETSP1467-20131203/2538_1 /TAXON_ID=1462469 /ORGANISM="unid. sp., Strain CCMP2135" /LENGTH=1105 /DNA_ID=CAMNT_0044382827 /DNA_START=1 /DNA_END=3318 /DNA_ORIENTATION=+